MSSSNRKREQAARLLRSIGEIEDRYLMEAMTPEEAKLYAGLTETDMQSSESAAGPEAAVPETQTRQETASAPEEAKQKGTGRKRLRRYSTWALTAAACLTVVVIGRYVSVSQVSMEKEQPTAVVKEEQTDRSSADIGEAVKEPDMEKAQTQENRSASEDAADAKATNGTSAEAAGAAQEENSATMEDAADAKAENGTSAEAAGTAQEENRAALEDAEAVQEENSAALEDAEAVQEENSVDLEAADDAGAEAAGAGAMLTMPNPFIETQTLEEACRKVGFSLSLPDEVDSLEKIYRVMTDQMIEVICLDEDGRERLRLRKGRDMTEDISGDYGEYAQSGILDQGSMNITVAGEDKDRWKAAHWTQTTEDTRYSYSITSGQGTMTGEEVIRMAGEMMGDPQ